MTDTGSTTCQPACRCRLYCYRMSLILVFFFLFFLIMRIINSDVLPFLETHIATNPFPIESSSFSVFPPPWHSRSRSHHHSNPSKTVELKKRCAFSSFLLGSYLSLNGVSLLSSLVLKLPGGCSHTQTLSFISISCSHRSSLQSDSRVINGSWLSDSLDSIDLFTAGQQILACSCTGGAEATRQGVLYHCWVWKGG